MKIKLEGKEFELTDSNKLERAKQSLKAGASATDLLFAYDKLGGRLVLEGKVLPPCSVN